MSEGYMPVLKAGEPVLPPGVVKRIADGDYAYDRIIATCPCCGGLRCSVVASESDAMELAGRWASRGLNVNRVTVKSSDPAPEYCSGVCGVSVVGSRSSDGVS